MGASCSKLLLATAVLTVGCVAAVLGGVFCFLSEPPLPRGFSVFVSLAGIGAAVFGWRLLSAANRADIDAAKARYREVPEETLVAWEVPLEHWQALAAKESASNEQAAPVAGGCFGLVLAAIFGWSFWKVAGPGGALLIGVAIGVVGGGLIAWVTAREKLVGFEEARAAGRGTVALRADGVLLNDVLVRWGGLHGSLRRFELEADGDLGFEVLRIRIRRAHSEGTHDIDLAVPVGGGERDGVARAAAVVRVGFGLDG